MTNEELQSAIEQAYRLITRSSPHSEEIRLARVQYERLLNLQYERAKEKTGEA